MSFPDGIHIDERLQGLFYKGRVTAVPGINQFTIVTMANFRAGTFADAIAPYNAFVFSDAAGTGAAPEGEQQSVTAYAPDGTFTTLPFTQPVAVGDDILLLHPNISTSVFVILAAINVPPPDSLINLIMRDVIGNKTDTANATVGATSSLMRYIKAILNQANKMLGAAPVVGQVVGAPAQWQGGFGTSGEVGSDLVTLGANDVRNKFHSLLVNISALTPGATITVKMFMQVNGVERRVYRQNFVQGVDPNGLWIVNGTVGIHEALRVEVQSNNALDNGLAVDWDYMLEVM